MDDVIIIHARITGNLSAKVAPGINLMLMQELFMLYSGKHAGTLLLTWSTFNPSMDKQSHAQ